MSKWTTISVKPETRQKLALLVGKREMYQWLDELADALLSASAPATLFDELTVKLRSYQNIDAANWPEVKGLLTVMIPAAIALDAGKSRADVEVYRLSMQAAYALPVVPMDLKQELVDEFEKMMHDEENKKKLTPKEYLESLDLENRPALKALITGGGGK